MWRLLIVVSFLTSASVVAAESLPVTPSPGRKVNYESRESKNKNVFADDVRFDKKLNFDRAVTSLGEIVRAMHAELGVDIAVQGALLNRPLSYEVHQRSARMVAEDLALLFGGTWVKREGGYFLITDEVTAKLVGAYRDRSTDTEEHVLFRSLTDEQQRVLKTNLRLPYSQLRPDQQSLCRAILMDRFLQAPSRYPSSIVRGVGVELTYPRRVIGGPAGVELQAPIVTDDGRLDSGLVAVLFPD